MPCVYICHISFCPFRVLSLCELSKRWEIIVIVFAYFPNGSFPVCFRFICAQAHSTHVWASVDSTIFKINLYTTYIYKKKNQQTKNSAIQSIKYGFSIAVAFNILYTHTSARSATYTCKINEHNAEWTLTKQQQQQQKKLP